MCACEGQAVFRQLYRGGGLGERGGDFGGRYHNSGGVRSAGHEAVETARHEKGLTVQEVQTRFERTGVRLELQERGGIIDGQAAADRWEVRIQSTKFRPEEFLRRITLLEQLEEGNGGSL